MIRIEDFQPGQELSADDLNRLVDALNRLLGFNVSKDCGLTLQWSPFGPILGYIAPRQALIAKTPSGGIAAMSGTTPGSATCRIWNRGPTGALVDSLVDVTVYNMSGSAVAGTKYIQAKRIDGVLWVDVESCS